MIKNIKTYDLEQSHCGVLTTSPTYFFTIPCLITYSTKLRNSAGEAIKQTLSESLPGAQFQTPNLYSLNAVHCSP